jgi:WD40 repeat protein
MTMLIATQILALPLSETAKNRDGIKHVLERTEWYWCLSALLLNPQGLDHRTLELQKLLRSNIVALYKQLLLFQIQSVCRYSRCEVAVILRDLVKLDDWETRVSTIEDLEQRVRTDVSQYNDENMVMSLRNLDSRLAGVAVTLDKFISVVEQNDKRQHEATEAAADAVFLQQMSELDPSTAKSKIERTKGGLIEEVHEMMLQQSGFDLLQDSSQKPVTWITGLPGQGKTMFMCGVVDRLVGRREPCIVSYFFCRADSSSSRTVTSVLRGLLWLICGQSWSIGRELRKKYMNHGKALFDGEDAATELEKMLAWVLSRSSMQRALLIIDAIDECDDERFELFNVIGRLVKTSSARWIISSRPDDAGVMPRSIYMRLEFDRQVLTPAIRAFVDFKVNALSDSPGYDDTVRDQVRDELYAKAGDTFLWVALVCLDVQRLRVKARNIKAHLEKVPEGLPKLYERMLKSALTSADGDLCGRILPLVSMTRRPLTLEELRLMVLTPSLLDDDVLDIVNSCGCFLTVNIDDAGSKTLVFVHESAREYLLNNPGPDVFPNSPMHYHRDVLQMCLNSMHGLKRNMYGLPTPGFDIADIKPPTPDPLNPYRYGCLHWIHHAVILHSEDLWQESDDSLIEEFLHTKLLHWLEVLSLMKSIAEGASAFRVLSEAYRNEVGTFSKITTLIMSAHRFIEYNRVAIEMAPLQVYASALLFSRRIGLRDITSLYQDHLDGISFHSSHSDPALSAASRMLPIDEIVTHLAFSLNGQMLIAGCADSGSFGPRWQDDRLLSPSSPNGSWGRRIKIWDIDDSCLVHTVDLDFIGDIAAVTFCQDAKQALVAVTRQTLVRIDADTGQRLPSFQLEHAFSSALFAPEGRYVAISTLSGQLSIVNCETGREVQLISDVWIRRDQAKMPRSKYVGITASFSPDDLRLACIHKDRTVSMRLVGGDAPIWRLWRRSRNIAFFGPERLAIHGEDGHIALVAVADGTELRTISLRQPLWYFCWLGPGTQFVASSRASSGVIAICEGSESTDTSWAPEEMHVTQSAKGFAVCSSRQTIAVVPHDGGHISLHALSDLEESGNEIREDPRQTRSIAFSKGKDSPALVALLTAAAQTARIEIVQRIESRTSSHTLSFDHEIKLLFSPCGTKLVAWDFDGFVQIFEVTTGAVTHMRHTGKFSGFLCFSPDGRHLALPQVGLEGDPMLEEELDLRRCPGLQIWDLRNDCISGAIPRTARAVAFAQNGQQLVWAEAGHVEVWTLSPWRCIAEYDFGYQPVFEHLKTYTGNFAENYAEIYAKTFGLTFSRSGLSLALIHGSSIHVWHMNADKSRGHRTWTLGENGLMNLRAELDGRGPHPIDLSPDGRMAATAQHDHVSVWFIGNEPSAPRSLEIQLPYMIETCLFDDTSSRLIVDSGTVTLPEVYGPAGDHVFETGDRPEFHGYSVSADKRWICQDGLKILYIPPEWRPTFLADYSFMGSTIAIATASEHLYILKFRGDSDPDMRWEKQEEMDRIVIR